MNLVVRSPVSLALAVGWLTLTVCCTPGAGAPDARADVEPSTRSFALGFTPWPENDTTEALDRVYQFLGTEGDLVAHHFQQGIPYVGTREDFDPLNFETWDPALKEEVDTRIARTDSRQVLYLAVDSCNMARDDLAGLWSQDGSTARPAPWNNRGFSSPEVISAYASFCVALVDRFRAQRGRLPDYFNYGPEVSDLMINSPQRFQDFEIFAKEIYGVLKHAFPGMALMVSVALKSPGSAEMATVKAGFARISEWVDVVGVSTYGFAFYADTQSGDPDDLPAEWISQIRTIAPGKPYGVTETSWISEDLDVDAPTWRLHVKGTQAGQDRYVVKLLNEADKLGMRMVIWFTAYDYKALWAGRLKQDPLSRIWRDTGLVGRPSPSSSLVPKTALGSWRLWAAKARTGGKAAGIGH